MLQVMAKCKEVDLNTLYRANIRLYVRTWYYLYRETSSTSSLMLPEDIWLVSVSHHWSYSLSRSHLVVVSFTVASHTSSSVNLADKMAEKSGKTGAISAGQSMQVEQFSALNGVKSCLIWKLFVLHKCTHRRLLALHTYYKNEARWGIYRS